MAPLRPFSLTHVEYEEGSRLGLACALLSLAPPFCIAVHAALLASRRDLHSAALLGGALLNVAANSALKAAAREPRPPAAQLRQPDGGDEFGWPSAHAQFAFFYAGYAALWALSGRWRVRLPVWRALVAAGGLAAAAAVAASRVALGYHTRAQVEAGAAIGAALGALFFAVVELALRPHFAALAAWAPLRVLRVRDCSEVDTLLVEYEAVQAASTAATAAAAARGKRRA
jgi:dolichyldiphosphatase